MTSSPPEIPNPPVPSRKDRLRRWLMPSLLVLAACAAVAAAVIHPSNPTGPQWTWYYRGSKAAAAHRPADAIRDFQRAIQIDPHFTQAYDLLAVAYFATHRADRALETLSQLQSLEPANAYLSTRISETYLPVDNLYMTRWAREAIVQDPRLPRAHMLLALGLARVNNGRDALAEARLAEQLAHSSLLMAVVKGNPRIASQPDQLVPTLQALVAQTPYE